MNLTTKATMIAAMALWAALSVASQQPADLAGTWSGEATLENMDRPNVLTLVLELKEGKLAGHMTDQFGSIDSDIKDIVLEQSAFNFTAPAMLPQGGEVSILFKMKVDGDSMKGEIEIPDMGAQGTWQATRQK
jgi:hypothetical protein